MDVLILIDYVSEYSFNIKKKWKILKLMNITSDYTISL
jgi:hypothetical protein